MTNGTDTTKFKLSVTDKVEVIGKESRLAPKLLTVSENGLTITKESGIERAVDILLDEVVLHLSCHLPHPIISSM